MNFLIKTNSIKSIDNYKIQQRLSEDIKKIYIELKKNNPIAIIIVGGYGRDEGSWIIENGRARPYNDYDITIVTENILPQNKIQKIRKQLAEEIGIRWIDIDQLTPKRLKKLKLKIKSYDLKYASKIIFGDKEILNNIHEYSAQNIPLAEIETLFYTRIWTFLGSLKENGFVVNIEREEARFFRNQMAKAVLAIVDINLLAKGLYHYSYKERVKRFKQNFFDKSTLCELAEWALEEKLFPKETLLTKEDIKKLYSTIHHFYLDEMFSALSRYYHIKITKPEQLEILLKWSIKNILRRIYLVLVKHTFDFERQIKIELSQLYLFAAYNNDGINQKYLSKGIKILRKLDKNININSSWDKARLIIANIRTL